jgi:Transmembrane family 220, helix
MRCLHGFLGVLLAGFTIVQYNDPDAVLWIVIYGLPAIWAGFAAYRPNAFEHNHLLVGVFWLNLLAIAAGSIYIWPSEVTTWWNNEEVREGLGLIITTIAMLMVAFTVWRTRRGQLEHFAT